MNACNNNLSLISSIAASVFGKDAEKLNVNRDPHTLGKIMTFNGNLNDLAN